MNNTCRIIRQNLESTFSMPFAVQQVLENGEQCYLCSPYNEGGTLVEVRVSVHNDIRIITRICPQIHAAELVRVAAHATSDQKEDFAEYARVLRTVFSARIDMRIDGNKVDPENSSLWPADWGYFECDVEKVPIDGTLSNRVNILSDWLFRSFNLIFTLLPIVDASEETNIPGDVEGNKFQIVANKYERSRANRDACLNRLGYRCKICNFDFEEKYGFIGRKFIHVHHLVPVSAMGENYRVNPLTDLIPVCPNCHAMLHTEQPPLTPSDLRRIIKDQKVEKLIIQDVPEKQKYVRYLPVFNVKAACGAFEEYGYLSTEQALGWIDVSSKFSSINANMFIVFAEGDSMYPMIESGDLCVFEKYQAGPRSGLVVLTQGKNVDDAYECSYTIKEYRSQKAIDDNGHEYNKRVTLHSKNPEYDDIELESDEYENPYCTIGIWKGKLDIN